MDVKKLYDKRFTSFERIRKKQLWKILCEDFLSQFINRSDTVVDLGAGNCEFINNIKCGKKIAVDLNQQIKDYSNKDVQLIVSSVKRIKDLFKENSIDVIFMSNLLEHLDSKEDIFRLLTEGYSVLKRGGRLLIMQPDIKLVGNEYWDFFDHKVAITCSSLIEVLFTIGYKIKFLRYPFLPYTTKVRYIPLWPWLLRLYIKLRPFHFLFGKQFFVCAQKA